MRRRAVSRNVGKCFRPKAERPSLNARCPQNARLGRLRAGDGVQRDGAKTRAARRAVRHNKRFAVPLNIRPSALRLSSARKVAGDWDALGTLVNSPWARYPQMTPKNSLRQSVFAFVL